MSARSVSGPPTPSALASLGALRECVAAASNLKGLLSSLQVGPKILSPVLPDVSTCLMAWQREFPALTSFIRRELELDSSELVTMETAALNGPADLVLALEQASRGPVHARARLAIERELNKSLPLMIGGLSQLELLVEVTCSASQPLLVREIFTRSEGKADKHAHRSVTLLGSVNNLEVFAPAQIVVRCLGALAANFSLEKGQSLALQVTEEEDFISFRLVSAEPGPSIVKIPVLPASTHTESTITTALRSFSGKLEEKEATLLLPINKAGPLKG